mgnify:CR=1 FL=1
MENKSVQLKTKKTLSGVVVSDKMAKTVVVEITRFVKHPKYKKYLKKSKRFKAHDEAGNKVGDKVSIVEIAPMSKDKHFKVVA